MCEPVSMIATVGSSLLGAVGAIQEGRAQKQQADYQAAVLNNNRILAERNAQDAINRGNIEEADHRKRVRSIMGQQRASLAAQGGTLDDGSALDILGDTAAMGELDALTIRSNAGREAYGYKLQGNDFSAEAKLAKQRGKYASRAGLMGAAGSLMSGATSISSRWSNYFGGSSPTNSLTEASRTSVYPTIINRY